MVKHHPDQLNLRKDPVTADMFLPSHLAVVGTVQHVDVAADQSEMVLPLHLAVVVVLSKSEAAKVDQAVNDTCHLLQAIQGFKPSVPLAPDLNICS